MRFARRTEFYVRAISGRREMTVARRHQGNPAREGSHYCFELLARRLMCEAARFVEECRRLTKKEHRLRQHQRLRGDQDMTQGALGKASSPPSARCPDHGNWLVDEHLVRRWPREPIDRVLENARQGLIVLGRRDE